jgi:hypothetical protein
MPVRFGDVNGDGKGDFIACPMLADSGPNHDRRDSGEVHIYFGTGVISGVIVNTAAATDITTIMGAHEGDLFGNETHVDDLNHDGLADIVMGSQNYDGPAGDRHCAVACSSTAGVRSTRARLISLQSEPPRRRTMSTIVGAEAGDRLGIWVNTGDVGGDGATWFSAPIGRWTRERPRRLRRGVCDLRRPDAATGDRPRRTRRAPHRRDHSIDPGDHLGSTIVVTDVDRDSLDDILIAGGLARGSARSKAASWPAAMGQRPARCRRRPPVRDAVSRRGRSRYRRRPTA